MALKLMDLRTATIEGSVDHSLNELATAEVHVCQKLFEDSEARNCSRPTRDPLH